LVERLGAPLTQAFGALKGKFFKLAAWGKAGDWPNRNIRIPIKWMGWINLETLAE
jgi:hypothetical protein